MGIKINYKSLNGLYAKVSQTNVKNKHNVSVNEETQEETILDTRPMDVVVHVYNDVDKTNKIDVVEFAGEIYDPTADDKDPVNQAYEIIKSRLDFMEDVI